MNKKDYIKGLFATAKQSDNFIKRSLADGMERFYIFFKINTEKRFISFSVFLFVVILLMLIFSPHEDLGKSFFNIINNFLRSESW